MVTHPETSFDPPFLTPPYIYGKSLANEIFFLHILLVLKFSSTSLEVQNVQLLYKMGAISIKQCLWYGTIYRSKNH